MKKSIAALLIGSALLLPNNNSVEASYSGNDVQVKKIQCVQYNRMGRQAVLLQQFTTRKIY